MESSATGKWFAFGYAICSNATHLLKMCCAVRTKESVGRLKVAENLYGRITCALRVFVRLSAHLNAQKPETRIERESSRSLFCCGALFFRDNHPSNTYNTRARKIQCLQNVAAGDGNECSMRSANKLWWQCECIYKFGTKNFKWHRKQRLTSCWMDDEWMASWNT